MAVNLIKKVKSYPNFDQLKKQVIELQTAVGLKIISLQSPGADNSGWNNAEGYQHGANEKKFCHIQPELAGTEIDQLLQAMDFPLYRARIMRVDPHSSYIVHADPTLRIHIPIETNDLCRFCFPKISDQLAEFMPADGSIYWVDTRQYHTFINNSDRPRTHIVAVTDHVFD